MRTFDKKNKISFNLFAVIIVLLVIIFGFVIFQVMNVDTEHYVISKGSVVYDETMKKIELSSPGTIEKKWDGSYYLSLDSGENFNLGEHNVVYDEEQKSMNILGDGYQVFTDGSLKPISKRTEITNLSEIMFFKLDDRNYLMNGFRIHDEEEGFTTKNYVQIDLDKSGNALLLNHEVNMKTVKPMILSSGDVRFDIANEKLIYKDHEVDLKSINGSTNEYKPMVEETKNEKEPPVKDVPSSIVSNNVGANNGQVFNYGGNTSGSGSNNTTGNGNNNNGGNTGNPSNPGNNNPNKPIYDRSISVRSVESGVTSLRINYMISDVENKFLDVHLIIQDTTGSQQKFTLNKSLTSADIRGLQPNTKYSVSLNYSMYINEKGESVKYDYTADDLDIRTKGVTASLAVEKITTDRLYFNVKLDRNFVVDKAVLHIRNADSQEDGDLVEVDVDKAIMSDGWSSSIKIDNTITRYELTLQDVMYGGEAIKVNAKLISVNEKNEDIISKIMDWFN